MSELPLGNSLRLGTIIRVDTTQVLCNYLGGLENNFACPIPVPYSGKGGGIFAGIEEGTVVLIAEGPGEERFIVGFVPIKQQWFDQEGVEDVEFDHTPLPQLESGQIILKSSDGSYIDIHPSGDIILDVGAGSHEADLELSKDSKALIFRVDNKYSFTEAGRSIEGIIKRDKNIYEGPLDTETFDFLRGVGYDRILEEIGRLPQYKVSEDTISFAQDFKRNPALVEKRDIVYEYADSFDVSKLTDEVLEMSLIEDEETENVIRLPGLRQNRRTDVLNLNMLNYNHLMERVEGTLVDIYGNILDINRNKIEIPDFDTLEFSKDPRAAIQTVYSYMRRSVKYHFEINSRKDISGDEPDRAKDTIKQREHSRWSIDVDGEGLTKINIPRSSDTGNIPVLGRYITSRNEEDKESGSFRDKQEKDIRMASFSANGPTISNSSYIPETIDESSVTAGTAYHDLMMVANSIFSSGAHGTGNRMSKEIINNIGNDNANAGGRSLNANLDGSIELSIGADTIDNKSLLLDLEGGVISHYGVDKGGRSIIHQSDGTALIQIGKEDVSGRLEIHISTGIKGKSQKIIIDESGMTLDVQGNMILNASGSIGISAGANLLLNGALVSVYGSVDASPKGTRTVGTGGTVITQSGMAHVGFFG